MNSGNKDLTRISSGLVIFGLLTMTSMCLAAADRWAGKADMPTPREGLSTSVVNGSIYAIGGLIANFQALSAVEEYDPRADRWTRLASMPTARRSLGTSVVDGRLYAIGGHRVGAGALRTVEEYDPLTDIWTRKTDMPTPRSGASANTVDGKIYVIGGSEGVPAQRANSVPLSVVEEYTPEGWPFAVSPRSKLSIMWGSIKRGR